MTKPAFTRLLLRATTNLGYGFCLLQWLWGATLYLPFLLESELFRIVTEQSASRRQPTPSSLDLSEASIVSFLLAALITIVFIVIAIAMIAKLPAAISRGIDTATHKTADTTLQLIAKHHKTTPKKRRQLSKRLVNLAIFALCLIPLIAGLIAPMFTDELPRDVIITVTLSLAVSAVLLLLPKTFSERA